MKLCPACSEENLPRARFCHACGLALDEPVAGTTESRRTVSVVFSDISGSTSLSQRLDPEIFRRVMSRYFEEMRTVLERHGGRVEKFIGDAVMAVFGIPTIHEDDALRAVRAADDMRSALELLNVELMDEAGVTMSLRTGVNTGEVVAGDPSAGTLVTGDAVNIAARLESAAKPGEILIGNDTYRFVRERGPHRTARTSHPQRDRPEGDGTPPARSDPGAVGALRRMDAPWLVATARSPLCAGYSTRRSLHAPVGS